MRQNSSARPPDDGSLRQADQILKIPDGRFRSNGKILKKEVLGYAGICLVLLIFFGVGGMLVRTFPVRAAAESFLYLVFGGFGMSAWLFCFCRRAEQSEFFKTFCWLYHPGIWILAVVSYLDGSGNIPESFTGNLHLAYIAGWTFLVAGVIVLIVILREGKT